MTRLVRYESLDGTSDQARRDLREGVSLPFAVAAQHQTAGRGRKGRSWVSARGVGLYLTLARPLQSVPEPYTLAPLAVGCGVADWLQDLGLHVRLKWPNDLRVDGAKVGGVLCEVVEDALLVGVGINWFDAPHVAGQTTASVHQFEPNPLPILTAQEALLGAIEGALDWWCAQGNAMVRSRWWSLAERHALRSPDHRGMPIGLAEDGALRLQDPSGAVHEIRGGDVEVVGP